MSFGNEATKCLAIIFDNINKSQNQRILNELKGIENQIKQEIAQLSEVEEHRETLAIFFNQLKSIENFTKSKGNLEQVWKLFHFKLYEQQEKMIQALKQYPKTLRDQIEKQNNPTKSMFMNQDIQELNPHQLIPFKITLDSTGVLVQDNEMDDYIGCLTIVSPKTQSSKIFSVNIKWRDVVRKVKKLEEVLQQFDLETQILKFKFDHGKKLLTFWSMDDKLGYCLTTRNNLEEKPIQVQKIYLQVGMKIQLTKKFSLIVRQSVNFCSNQQQVNQYFKPLTMDEKQNLSQLSTKLYVSKLDFIELGNDFENVIIYPNKLSIKLSTLLSLPKGIEVYVYNDGFGNFIEIVSSNKSYVPRILSQNLLKFPIQFNTQQTELQIGIVLEDSIKLWFSSKIDEIWQGKDLFDL